MGFLVSDGALLSCDFGAAPSPLTVTPANKCMSARPLANVMDNKPFVNIMPFGVCSCMGNPSVAASPSKTAACTLNIAGPWVSGAAKTMIGGSLALDDSGKLICAFGAVIAIKTLSSSDITVS